MLHMRYCCKRKNKSADFLAFLVYLACKCFSFLEISYFFSFWVKLKIPPLDFRVDKLIYLEVGSKSFIDSELVYFGEVLIIKFWDNNILSAHLPVSLAYLLRIIKWMCMEKRPNCQP